jgi:tetratricopeptide (TPR) repeat protein
MRLAPGDPDVYYEVGAELSALGRHEDAVEHYASLIRRWPGDARAWSKLGLAYHRLGRHVEATRAWERTLALKPRYFSGMLTSDEDAERVRYEISRKTAGAQPPAVVDSLP